MSNETFLSQLQSIIGKTLRQIQLHTGEMKVILRMVAKWLISARKAIYEGNRQTAESDLRIALKILRVGRANTQGAY